MVQSPCWDGAQSMWEVAGTPKPRCWGGEGLPPLQPPWFSHPWHLSLMEKAPTTGCKLSLAEYFHTCWVAYCDLRVLQSPALSVGFWGLANPRALISPSSLCRRLELNGIKSIPPGAFSPYKKLRRM